MGIHYNWSWANVTPTCWCNVAPMSKIALGWCYFSHWAHISDYFGPTLDQNKLAIWEGVVRYISDRNFTLLQFWTTELILVMITYIIIYKIKLFHFQTQDWSIIQKNWRMYAFIFWSGLYTKNIVTENTTNGYKIFLHVMYISNTS